MSVFTEKSFLELMDKLIVIHPLCQECITGVGYDLNIGFFVQINRPQRKIEASEEVGETIPRERVLSSDSYLVIVTREFVYPHLYPERSNETTIKIKRCEKSYTMRKNRNRTRKNLRLRIFARQPIRPWAPDNSIVLGELLSVQVARLHPEKKKPRRPRTNLEIPVFGRASTSSVFSDKLFGFSRRSSFGW